MGALRISNVLFLQPSGGIINFSPPLGLLSVATYLRSKLPSVKVKVVDLSVEEVEIEDLIQSFHPDLIGITGVTPIARDIRLLVEKIRLLKAGIPIVLGGPHVTAVGPDAFSLSIDFAVSGEGEETLAHLVRVLESGDSLSEVEGLLYRDQGGLVKTNKPRELIRDIDSIPVPDWSLVSLDKYVYKGVVISTRGCPYNCIFCSQSFGRSWRAHSAQYVFDAVKELVDKYRIRTVRFMDDNPLINTGRFYKICELIISNGYLDKVTIDLNHGTRMDVVDRELFLMLKRIGTKNIWFGLESAVPEVLSGMRKNLSLANISKSIALARSLGFTVNAFITIGMPSDTYERSMETMRYVQSHKINLVSPAVATPFPGTDLFDWVEKNGRWINKDYETWISTQSILFDTEDFVREERERALKKWLRFCALQRVKLALQRPQESFFYFVRSPKIAIDSLRNLFGKPWYDKGRNKATVS